MNKIRVKRFVIIGILLLVGLVIGGTYAWITFTTGEISVAGNTHCFNINYVKGKDIQGNIAPINEDSYLTSSTIKLSTLMGSAPVSMELDGICNLLSGIGTIELNINTLSDAYTSIGASYGSLKYVVAEYDPSLYADSTPTSLKNHTFKYIRRGVISETGTIDIHTQYLKAGVKHNYIVIIYLDSNLVGNDIIGASVSASVSARASQFIPTSLNEFTYYTDEYNGITVPSDTVLLTSYNGSDEVVNVPDTYTIGDNVYNVMVYSDSTNNTSLFSDNIDIVEVNFADGVLFSSYDGSDLISNSANSLFKGCTSLVSAPRMSDDITDMDNTFYGCTSLTNINYIPSSVTSMNSTFYGCTNLEGIVKIISEDVVANSSVFTGTTKTINLEIPYRTTTYGSFDGNVPANVNVIEFLTD